MLLCQIHEKGFLARVKSILVAFLLQGSGHTSGQWYLQILGAFIYC